ncbi:MULTISPECIES: DUF4845 domain-containing protein [Marinobacter]|jgi:hypothetical protein|uniref:DUF4845 domain-containing protein n=1 Tax=Marinobacter TaxID=2742 RepID=UPI0020041EE4|nr:MULTISPECIES: DUF4845 domain-containing protein [Marinobacter]MCK7551204.1 DUF4845 domain-containing protein [Marinobacter goseongensis]MDV3505029.1 DUF4845 domain-containing protein [Marinobacter sp. M-5]
MKNNNLSCMGRQGGASALTMLVMVLFFGSLLTLVIKLGPVYLDDITIQEALEGLDGTEGLSRMGPAEVRGLINKRLSVNNVRGFDAKDITVEKDGELVLIKVDYEVRNNLFRNVDTVIHFKHEYEMQGQ